MARGKPLPQKKKRKRAKRSTAEYLSSAKNLSTLVPSLRKLAHRKTLRPSEKAAITRKEKALKNVPNIFPVSAKVAKERKAQLFAPGVRGIQLRGVSPNAKIRFVRKDIEIDDNGHKWIYWHLDRKTVRSRRGMRDAGSKAFNQQFPIERISDLAEKAFKQYNVVQVNLWAHAGVVGDPHETLSEFVQWVNEKWNAGRYTRVSEYGGNSDPAKWVNGIAILLENKEYAAKRAALKKQNSGYLDELKAQGDAYRESERKRLVAKGLIPDETIKRKITQKATKSTAKSKAKTPSRKTMHVKSVRKNRNRSRKKN